jgi:phage/plasmid-like protein (TIGR03299 family)
MSRETLEWLSNNTLIGFTEKRGHAWHHRAGDQNWYPGAIPVEDVRKRLFAWHAQERPIYVGGEGDPFTAQLNAYEIPGSKAIVRSDSGNVLGIFKDGYQPHQYDEWLLDNVATILDDSLQIGSAGLLKGGAVAWVSVEMPETLETVQGIRFRPFLLAATSFDGSVATTY